MFKELMPLIETRPLTLTVAAIGEGKIRVSVVPHTWDKDGKVNEKIGYSAKDKVAAVPEAAIKALTTPLSLSGTPEEIDAELPAQLATYVDSHVGLQRSVDRARQEIAEAVKAIEERDKNRSKSKIAQPAQAEKAQEAKPDADNLSLFEAKAAANP